MSDGITPAKIIEQPAIQLCSTQIRLHICDIHAHRHASLLRSSCPEVHRLQETQSSSSIYPGDSWMLLIVSIWPHRILAANDKSFKTCGRSNCPGAGLQLQLKLTSFIVVK